MPTFLAEDLTNNRMVHLCLSNSIVAKIKSILAENDVEDLVRGFDDGISALDVNLRLEYRHDRKLIQLGIRNSLEKGRIRLGTRLRLFWNSECIDVGVG